MINLNEFREVCKSIEGLVVPFLAAILILWCLLHDSTALQRIEKRQLTDSAAVGKIDERTDRIEQILREYLRPELYERVIGDMNEQATKKRH